MEKPFTLRVEELEQQIIKAVNTSELPAFCVKTILQSILKEVENIDVQEIAKYQKEQKENENKEEK